MPSATPRSTSATRRLDPVVPRAPSAGSRGHDRLSARVPRAARAEEERDLDACLRAERRHVADLAVREHHHAAALRDAPHGHGARSGFLEDGLEDARPLDGRDLDPIAEPVREARVAHARI